MERISEDIGSSSSAHAKENTERKKHEQPKRPAKAQEQSKEVFKRIRVDNMTNPEPQQESITDHQTSGTQNCSPPNPDLFVITTKNRSDLTKEEYTTILFEINKIFLATSKPNCKLKQANFNFSNGVIGLVDLNAESKAWIKRHLPNIKSSKIPQEKLPLELVSEKDIFKKIKCDVKVLSEYTRNKVFTDLKSSNSWAQVDNWTLYDFYKKESENYLYVTLGIPSDVVFKINNNEALLYYGIDPVELRERYDINEISTDHETEAGPSGIQSQRREEEWSRYDKSDRRSSESSGLEMTREEKPRQPSGHVQGQRSGQPSGEGQREKPRRRYWEDTRGSKDFKNFMTYEYETEDKINFPEFVARKCELAEKLINTTLTEQDLVTATIVTLPSYKIKNELLGNVPETLKDLKKCLKHYNWCEKCFRLGHKIEYCRRK